ncbi:MAG: hypothetical protein GY747_12850 [Planctomycetes bacterium]|nr:hypothetical protein [Planctomycetota bacterium]MCP4770566.1 hypothetical protein [Planctomycetota bacterium]MCP4860343.1 hypothetical protein [Planctomycetota bacterium]
MKAPLALFVLAFAIPFASCSKDAEPTTDTSSVVIADDGVWLESFEKEARAGNAEGALSLFERVLAENSALLTSDNLLKMATLAAEGAKSVELTQPILDYALETYPRDIGKFGGVDAAIYRMNNPAAADVPMDGAHAPIEGAADPKTDGAEEE